MKQKDLRIFITLSEDEVRELLRNDGVSLLIEVGKNVRNVVVDRFIDEYFHEREYVNHLNKPEEIRPIAVDGKQDGLRKVDWKDEWDEWFRERKKENLND